MLKNKAIFFDKDNTLIKDQVYNCTFKKELFYKDSIEILKYLSKKEYLIFIVSNQSGINRNYFSKDYYLSQMSILLNYLNSLNIYIIDHIFCPHLPEENCLCRKPKIGMVKKIEAYYNIDLKKSYLVGDRISDIEMAINSDLIPVFIERGYPVINDKNNKNRNDNKNLYILSEEYVKLVKNNKMFKIKNLNDLKNIVI